MEKPDENGYINVTWPSKNIPHGGIFHTRQVAPTATQQEFLKVLLEESKLTIAQRQNSAWKLRDDNSKEEEMHEPIGRTLVRPRTSKRRSLCAIKESGDLDVDGYRPMKRGEDRERMKERLANTMAYGDTVEQVQTPPHVAVKQPPKVPTEKEKRNELLTQIRERVDWLAEMEYLGHAGPHREIIQEQIAERMRALDAYGDASLVSTARSTVSGFSTLRSRENMLALRPASKLSIGSGGSKQSVVHSSGSNGPQRKHITKKQTGKGQSKEEHVAAYAGYTSPLQYSPRRRV